MNMKKKSDSSRIHPAAPLNSQKKKPAKKFTVIVATDVPNYGRVDVEATSAAEAERIVAESFESEGLESPYWDAANGFKPDWSNCHDLRTVCTAS
jgi:hypothetical protein